MYGKCARDITYVPEMCLVETFQVNGSSPFNVPDMFLPVSRGPCPQCVFLVTAVTGGVCHGGNVANMSVNQKGVRTDCFTGEI